jgi:hypothetical protein
MHATQTYEGRPSDAERQYLDIARSLGWIEGSPAASAAADDETEGQGGGGGDGTGMGASVSVISPPPTLDDLDDSSRLHEYAMRGDVVALSAFLSADEEGAGADINVRDEYVSLFIMPPCHSFLRATGAVIFFGLVCCVRVSRRRAFTRTGIYCAPPGCRSGKRLHSRVSTRARRR